MTGGYGDSCEQDRENETEWSQMVLGVQGHVTMAISALLTLLDFLPVPLLRNTLYFPSLYLTEQNKSKYLTFLTYESWRIWSKYRKSSQIIAVAVVWIFGIDHG